MVDTVKILGALLGGGGMSSGTGADILKSVVGAALSGKKGSGLEDLLGSVLGGGQSNNSGGGLGDILGSVLGGGSGSGGGLGDILGSVLGGAQANKGKRGGSGKSGGALGDILGGVLKGGGGKSGGADLGDLIGAALNQFGHAEQAAQQNSQPKRFEEHSPGMVHSEANDQATLMIRGMINAAKSDGRLDREEKSRITGKLGNVTQDEIEFIQNEIAQPLDVEGFVESIPKGMGNQVYAMSLTAIDLDSNAEAQYLHQLAQGLGMDEKTVNQIHAQLGAPTLYS